MTLTTSMTEMTMAKKNSKAEETPAPQPHHHRQPREPRAQHGITQWEFVWAWETSDTVDQAVEKLAAICRKAGKAPISRSAVLAKAGSYRTQKILLKKMKRETERSLKVDELNDMIAQIRRMVANGEEVAKPPVSRDEDPEEDRRDEPEANESSPVLELLKARPKKR